MFYYHYQIHKLNFTIAEEEHLITNISLGTIKLKGTYQETPLLQKTKQELEEYFLKIRKKFDIPLKLTGTSFQNKVWQEMRKIPYGTTLTYQELAIKCGNKKASRAIGNACHNNKILILIPCHRVLAKKDLGGFRCGIDIKTKLLEMEGVL